MRGIRAISIDPLARLVNAIEISPETRRLANFFGEKPSKILFSQNFIVARYLLRFVRHMGWR